MPFLGSPLRAGGSPAYGEAKRVDGIRLLERETVAASLAAMDTSAAERAGIVTSGQDPPARPNLLVRRALVLAAILVGCVMAYGLMLAQFDLSKRPGEAEFGAPFSDGPVRLYLQPIQIDPLNASLQMRISVAPAPARATIGDRDFVLNI